MSSECQDAALAGLELHSGKSCERLSADSMFCSGCKFVIIELHTPCNVFKTFPSSVSFSGHSMCRQPAGIRRVSHSEDSEPCNARNPAGFAVMQLKLTPEEIKELEEPYKPRDIIGHW
jgi:hypothetical protein